MVNLATVSDFCDYYNIDQNQLIEKYPNINNDILKATLIINSYCNISSVPKNETTTKACIFQVEYMNSDEFKLKNMSGSYKVGDISITNNNKNIKSDIISPYCRSLLNMEGYINRKL